MTLLERAVEIANNIQNPPKWEIDGIPLRFDFTDNEKTLSQALLEVVEELSKAICTWCGDKFKKDSDHMLHCKQSPLVNWFKKAEQKIEQQSEALREAEELIRELQGGCGCREPDLTAQNWLDRHGSKNE